MFIKIDKSSISDEAQLTVHTPATVDIFIDLMTDNLDRHQTISATTRNLIFHNKA